MIRCKENRGETKERKWACVCVVIKMNKSRPKTRLSFRELEMQVNDAVEDCRKHLRWHAVDAIGVQSRWQSEGRLHFASVSVE